MKVSDPIIFGHAVKVFFKDLIAKHAARLEELGVDFNNGFGDLVAKIQSLPADKKAEIEADIQAAYANGPALAMVNSDKGITNLHVPSDVIVDASMPAMIRTSGQMWNAAGQAAGHPRRHPRQLLRRRLPDHHRFLQKARRARSATMGTVPNVGLMAQAAEEYGSHNKTFEIPGNGTVRVVDDSRQGPPRARRRSRRHLARLPDQGRPGPRLGEARRQPRPRHQHARRLLARRKARPRRPDHRQGENLPRRITTPRASTSASSRPPKPASSRSSASRQGKDTISVTGNVLRDYLTDLFPILEARHQRQDALHRSADERRRPLRNRRRRLRAETRPAVRRRKTTCAGTRSANSSPSPSRSSTSAKPSRTRRPRSSPTRSTQPPASSWKTTSRPAAKLGTHRQPRQPLLPRPLLGPGPRRAEQGRRTESASSPRSPKQLTANEKKIVAELLAVQGKPVDIGGYYQPDDSQGLRRPAPERDVQRDPRRALSGMRRRANTPSSGSP